MRSMWEAEGSAEFGMRSSELREFRTPSSALRTAPRCGFHDSLFGGFGG